MKKLTRRKFLTDAAAAGAAIPLVAIAAGCEEKKEAGPPKEGEPKPEEAAKPAAEAAKPTEEAAKAEGEPEHQPSPPASDEMICDKAKLTDTDNKQREALAYVEKTPIAAKTCDNCILYVPDAACKGCKLFRGPVEPKGYCASWAPM